MSDLSLFFSQNVESEITEEVVVSKRMKDKGGNPVAWKLRSLTEEENTAIRDTATKRVKQKNGVYLPETNPTEYVARLVAASVVFPNLKDTELQKSYSVHGEAALLRKMLLSGEYAALAQKVQELSGFNADINELADEVKN